MAATRVAAALAVPAATEEATALGAVATALGAVTSLKYDGRDRMRFQVRYERSEGQPELEIQG